MPMMSRVVMLLETGSYPLELRIPQEAEAEALARTGYEVTVRAPRADGQSRRSLTHPKSVT